MRLGDFNFSSIKKAIVAQKVGHSIFEIITKKKQNSFINTIT